eukprot:GILI01032011.1.p1 GENE.GILI01032011.1~~GILI01032011.1.p1  ORF type:complete len:251 (+),score=-9.64 GILI01032011.1:22-753(+)
MNINDYVPGVIAGTSAALVTHPLDVMRVRSQLAERPSRRFTSLYVGISAAILRETMYTGVRLPLYTTLKKKTNKVLSGAVAGAVGTCLAHPLDLVKVVKVCTPLKASNSKIMGNLIRNGQCFKGLAPAIQRSVLFSSVQLSTFDTCKEGILDLDWDLDAKVAVPVAAWIAGCASTVTSTPFDVIKTRVMVGNGLGSLQCMKRLVKDDGFKALWRGGGLTWLRLGPYTFIQMSVWEYSLSLLKN